MSRLSPPMEQWVGGPRPTSPSAASGTNGAGSSSSSDASMSSSIRNERDKNQQRQRTQDTADRKQLAQLMLEVARVKAGNSSLQTAESASTKPKTKRTKQAVAEENALFERLRDERLARKRQREEEERNSPSAQEAESEERMSSKKKKKQKKQKEKKHERKRRHEVREEKRERKRIKREAEERQRRSEESESQPALVGSNDEVAEVVHVNSDADDSDAESDCSSSSSVVVLQEPPRSSSLAPMNSPSIPQSTMAFIDLTGAPRTKYVSSDDVCSVDLNLDSGDRKAMKKQIRAQAKRHKTHLASVLLQCEQNDFVPLMEYCEEHALEFGFQSAMYKHYSGASGLCYRSRVRALETAVWSLPASLHLASGDELYRLEMRRLRIKLNDLASDSKGRLKDVDEDVAELMRRLINEMLVAMLRASFAWKSIVHLHADAEQPLQQEPVFQDLNVQQFETIKNNYFQDKNRKKISAPTQAEVIAHSTPTPTATATVTPRVSSTGASFDVTVHHSSTSNNQTTKTPVRPRITAPISPLPTTPPAATSPASSCCKHCGCTKLTGSSSSTDNSSNGSPSPARTSSHRTSSSSASSLSSTPSTTTVVLNFAQPPTQQQHQPPISLWNPYPHWQHPQLPMPALSLASSQPSDSTTTKSRKARSLASLLNAPTPGGYMPYMSHLMQPSPFYYSPSPLQYLSSQTQSGFPYGTSFIPTTPVAASIPATAVASTSLTPKIRAPSAVDTSSPATFTHGPLSPSNHTTTTSFEMPPAVLRVKSKASTKSISISAPPVQKHKQSSSHSRSSKHRRDK